MNRVAAKESYSLFVSSINHYLGKSTLSGKLLHANPRFLVKNSIFFKEICKTKTIAV